MEKLTTLPTMRKPASFMRSAIEVVKVLSAAEMECRWQMKNMPADELRDKRLNIVHAVQALKLWQEAQVLRHCNNARAGISICHASEDVSRCGELADLKNMIEVGVHLLECIGYRGENKVSGTITPPKPEDWFCCPC